MTLKGSANPAYAYLFVTLVWVAIAGSHAVVDGQDLALPANVWPYAIISAVSLSIYYYGTLASLRRGNLSVYYPIIRSSPLAIVAFNWVVVSQTYSVATLVGIGLIIFAGLAIQRTPGSLFDDWRALLLALMAMLASASYAIADAVAMQHASPAAFLFWVYSL